MRITSNMYYDNLFGANSSKLNTNLFDVNKQISSGLKIQYAKDDVTVFTRTMQLDNTMSSLNQIKKSAENGYSVSNQTDTVLNQFDNTIDSMKVLLIQASNATQSNASMDADATQLRKYEEHLQNLANTSINGEYIFAGSATDIKPIDNNGKYLGNDGIRNSFIGSGIKQQYNMNGAELFLGEEVNTKREITSNVAQYNLSAKYPDFSDSTSSKNGSDKFITGSDSIRDLMGDINKEPNSAILSHFYVRGTKSNGSTFHKDITMNNSDSVDNLLTQIGNSYGNTENLKLVDVSLNSSGEIVVQDKLKGSSKLDFHIVGAIDYDQNDGHDDANISDVVYGANTGKINNLDSGEKDFNKIINGSSSAANNKLYVKEFIKSDFSSVDGVASNIEGLVYDRTNFSKNASKLTSNISQILKSTNAFATNSTKISEVADLSQGTAGTLSGTQFTLSGTNINGTAFKAQVDFKDSASGGSTFSLDGGVTNYTIFDMNSPRGAVNADDMTYQQLMDVTNMIVTNQLPATTNSDTDYDSAINLSNNSASVSLSYNGKIAFEDKTNSDTKASLAIYDSKSGDFSNGASSSVLTFNANDSLTISDPKTDFFKSIDTVITAVESHKLHPDSKNGDTRNIGMSNAITMLENMRKHISKSHTQVGANSNALTNAMDRTDLLQTSTMTFRSSVIDTDLATAALKLQQLTINYQSILSTIGKVSKLSLVNYL